MDDGQLAFYFNNWQSITALPQLPCFPVLLGVLLSVNMTLIPRHTKELRAIYLQSLLAVTSQGDEEHNC